ncbi:iron chelate uptake ABC transporter family permease subunit, partial [Mycobacterium tuberculosis]|nr:iron chelate uptake ABC transporter family permease subunit [Mycobacterium tuberculosis]
ALYHGCGRLVWMFILYWLYNPILELVDGLHAYQGLLVYTQPLLEGISPAWLCFSIFAFNIIGHVPGAAVAQMTFTHKIFGPMLMAAVLLGKGTLPGWPVGLCADLGALLITFILLRFARRHLSTSRLLLAGVALGIICSALMTWAVYFSTSFDLRQL